MKNKISVTKYWEDTKRWCGMPITFTHYSIDTVCINITTGIFGTDSGGCRLHQVEKTSCSRSLSQRIFGLGTVKVFYCETSGTRGTLRLQNIPNPNEVKYLIDKYSEEASIRHRYTYRNNLYEDQPKTNYRQLPNGREARPS